MEVEITTTHTNGASRLKRLAQSKPANQPASGTASACARPTPPKPTPTMSIRSGIEGMRACAAW